MINATRPDENHSVRSIIGLDVVTQIEDDLLVLFIDFDLLP
jgi:hypothetical protein